MSVTLANSAGFCFGVDRAVKTVYKLLEQGEKVSTLGPIIHNRQMVEELESKGVKTISCISEAEKDEVLVIRAHGIPEADLEEIKQSGIKFVDATCPFVTKIHQLVKKHSLDGKTILIAGDKEHPEVKGIIGYCQTQAFAFKTFEEFEEILEKNQNFSEKSVLMCAQTTFNVSLWEKCLKSIKKVCTNAIIFDTICRATVIRQSEAEMLAQNNDVMIVVGGKESSNTAKLAEVCKKYTTTYLIEEAYQLPKLQSKIKIGITAGASTPASIIKEVLVTMTEINEIPEMNFEELLEESLKSFNTDEKVRGVVVSIAQNEVYVDVGRKQAGFIPANELSQDPNAKPEDVVKVGDEIDLLIMKTNDQEGTIMLSKKRIDALKGWDDLQVALDDNAILEAKVTEVVKGGVIIAYNGVRVFIPASQATANRGDALEELKGEVKQFKIIEVNRQRRRAVGSIRVVAREERKAAQAKLWETLEEGQTFDGTVKSLTSFGAFVDLGGVDGMVHISELSWNRIKHPSEVIAVGDVLNVYIKSLDKENSRISLGYKKAEDNPWEVLKASYPVGTVCPAKIVSMTTFGAFARILPGVDGLIHISQIADKRIEKPQDVLKVGQEVDVKITEVDLDKKRISLSIRALLEDTDETEEV
ncbi:MAG: bifunctional 4-hydroxy-3-methylbut-2-enyl diphosphate reductase/30S ribosomal protein S1 [Clostridia bacterium]